MNYDLCVVGGFGHVGLPLSIAFASKGLKVCAFDISKDTHQVIASGRMPFLEYGSEEPLRQVLEAGTLTITLEAENISRADALVIVTGTPVDRHLNPVMEELLGVFRSYLLHLRDGQLVILRSTVFPGTSQKVDRFLKDNGKRVDVAFCPERIAEGYALRELFDLPHIVSSFSENGVERARALFSLLNPEIVVLDPLEAELTKLFTNAYRYVKFGIANQFFMIANDCGADYYKIHDAIRHKYPRAKDLPTPGFAAGPCLFKDTVQLSAFNNHNFYLGHSSLLINEGLPSYIVGKVREKFDLKKMTVGILGMAFKADIDDKRESLSYKLKKVLEIEAENVLCSDVHIREPGFVNEEELFSRSDLVIVGSPHREYRTLDIRDKWVIDVWNIFGKGCRI
jgi:UDP-N-acetyl-D-mannosaminuronic acid dehydrogenase